MALSITLFATCSEMKVEIDMRLGLCRSLGFTECPGTFIRNFLKSSWIIFTISNLQKILFRPDAAKNGIPFPLEWMGA